AGGFMGGVAALRRGDRRPAAGCRRDRHPDPGGAGRACRSSPLSAAMHPALVDIRRQWQASQRLRIGVLAIGAILLVWLFLVLQDWRASLAQEYAARTEHLYKMQALAGQDEWIERARSTAEARAALEAELPDAATPGLAQANVQGWVRDLVKAYGEQGVQVQAQDAMPVDGHPGVWRVPVAISGPYRP